METLDCIKARASVRSFRKEPVPESALKAVLEAGINAPSAGNTQDWEFIIVKNPATKKALSGAAFDQGFVAQAPVVIVVCSDIRRISAAYGSRGVSLYSVQDTAAAVQNIMLAACDLGLGTCWVGAFSEERVRSILKVPESVRPLAIIPLGYPAGRPGKTRRMELERVMHHEKF